MLKEGDIFHGRKILYQEVLQGLSDNDFWGYHKATKRLGDMGYDFGSMEGPHPIAFTAKTQFSFSPVIPKWRYITPGMKMELDGVMVAHNKDWRHGNIQILWWEYPVVSPLDQIPWESIV